MIITYFIKITKKIIKSLNNISEPFTAPLEATRRLQREPPRLYIALLTFYKRSISVKRLAEINIPAVFIYLFTFNKELYLIDRIKFGKRIDN